MSVICTVFILAIGLYLAISVLIFAFYWYEKGNNPCLELKQPDCNILSAMRLWLCFTGAELMRIYSMIHWTIKQQKAPTPLQGGANLSRPVVVLVHGLYDKPSSWLLMSHYLEKAGYQAVTFSYKSLRGSNESIVKEFDAFMNFVNASFPGQKCLLVGHSLGGLVLRSWLAQPGNEEKATGLITIGTPHKGTRMALFAPGHVSRCLLPTSTFIETLAAAPKPEIPCVAFVSGEDEIILPGANLLPPDGWKMVLVEKAGHLAQIFCPRTIKNIIREIAEIPGMEPGVATVQQTAPAAAPATEPAAAEEKSTEEKPTEEKAEEQAPEDQNTEDQNTEDQKPKGKKGK